MFLEATGAATVNDALHLFYTDEWPRSRVATLAREVDRLAAAGDAAAREVLDQAATELAALVFAVRERIWNPGEAGRVSYIGGVFHSAAVLERFRTLAEKDHQVAEPPLYGPASGALLEAWRAVGLNPDRGGLPNR
jgi:N-acetylglucosamine kinase-like BadF-type ATPase